MCFNAESISALFFAEYFHAKLVWLFVRVPEPVVFFADWVFCRHMYLRKKGTKERSKKDYRTKKKLVRKGISINN